MASKRPDGDVWNIVDKVWHYYLAVHRDAYW